MNKHFRPRRSMLYVPGSNPAHIEKSRSLLVDAVILDLNDPVHIDKKEEARRNVVDALQQGGFGQREVVVRVNNLDSPWGKDDVAAVANLGADAILFPNIESRNDVLKAIELLDANSATDMPIMTMIETPLGVLKSEEIVSTSDRIACVVLGTSDLLTQLNGRRTRDRLPLITSLSLVVLAARAYHRAVVDGISTDIKDMQDFEHACRLARDLGFDGKTLVHPNQLAYCNEAFTPKDTDVRSAKEVIAALEIAMKESKATAMANGRLVEKHHVESSKRLIALHEMIKKLEAELDN